MLQLFGRCRYQIAGRIVEKQQLDIFIISSNTSLVSELLSFLLKILTGTALRPNGVEGVDEHHDEASIKEVETQGYFL